MKRLKGKIMGKNKSLKYLLVTVLLTLCSACSKKEEAKKQSLIDDSLEYLEKLALKYYDGVPSFSLSYESESEGIIRFEVRYIGALNECDPKYVILNERMYFGRFENSLHLVDKLAIFSDDVKLGTYSPFDNEYDFSLDDYSIVLTYKKTNISTTISLSDGIPDVIFAWADSTGGNEFGFLSEKVDN